MKKLMLGVLAFTLVFSSCKKYDNDFAALKDQIAALATQVAGVSALQSQLTATTAQVTALQTAVASVATNQGTQSASLTTLAANLATAKTAIDGITTTLGTVATSGTATKAVVDQLKLDLAALATKVTTLGTTVDANNTAAVAANAAAIAANTATLGKIAAAQTSLDGIVTFEGTLATTAVVNALTTQLAAEKAVVDQILSNTAMYTGSVSLTSDAEVSFYKAKLSSMPIINGSVTINPANITALADLALVTKAITAVLANVTVTGSATAANAVNLSNLVSVTGNVQITGAASVSASAVNISKLTTVNGTFIYSLDGAISLPLLATVTGATTLTPYTTDAAAATPVIGTTSVNLPLLTTASVNTASFPSATTVVMPATGLPGSALLVATSVTLTGNVAATFSLTANAANTVVLGSSANLTALTISATNAGSSVTVNAPAVTGALSITGSATSSVSLPTLVAAGAGVTVTALTVSAPALVSIGGAAAFTSTTPLSLPALNAVVGTITAASAVTVNLPALKLTAFATFNAATTATLLSSTETNLSAANNPALANLTLLGLSEVFTTTATSPLKAVNITGLAGFTNSFTYTTPNAAANSLLESASFKGFINTVAVNGTGTAGDKLTSLTTAGIINSFTLDNSDVISSISLGHVSFSTANSTLVVTRNAELLSLTTSTSKPVTLTVTGNAKLATANFASYAAAGTVAAAITIGGNAFSYSYTTAVAATVTSTYKETTITCIPLKTLKPMVAAGFALSTYSINADIFIATDGTATAALLSTKMLADTDAGLEYKKTCTATVQPVMAATALGVDDVTIAAGTMVGPTFALTTNTISLTDAARAGISNKVEMTRVNN